MQKRLGQHFLTSSAIATQIIFASGIGSKDTVLEIGAGKGMLTAELAKSAGRVIAVEKDLALLPLLASAIPQSPALRVHIVAGDIRDLLRDKIFQKKLGTTYHVVANIPYYLTGQLFRLLLQDAFAFPKSITVLVQKEVAERIVAKPPHMNMLALSLQSYGKAKIVRGVSKGCFHPQPKVDSSIIHIGAISKKFFLRQRIDEKKFFALLKRGFAHKRKLLKSNLGGIMKDSASMFQRCRVHPLSRPENLSLDDWTCLYAHMNAEDTRQANIKRSYGVLFSTCRTRKFP